MMNRNPDGKAANRRMLGPKPFPTHGHGAFDFLGICEQGRQKASSLQIQGSLRKALNMILLISTEF